MVQPPLPTRLPVLPPHLLFAASANVLRIMILPGSKKRVEEGFAMKEQAGCRLLGAPGSSGWREVYGKHPHGSGAQVPLQVHD